MTPAWPRSLQARLLSLVLGTVVGVWISSVALTWFHVRHELDELLDAHLAQAAALLVARQAGEIEDDEHGIDAPSLHRYAPRVAFQVFHEGRLVLRSSNAPAQPMLADPSFRAGFRSVSIGATTWRLFAAQGGRRDVQVYVGEQAASRADILHAVLRSTLWPNMLALPLLALAAVWAVRRGVEPLRSLGGVLAARRPAAVEPVELADVPTEMAPLLDALNRLFARIGAMVESERRFTADAAHELRTPIAGIRAQAQVALAAGDDGQRRHALLRTLEGCDRAARLIDQLLILARLDADGSAALGAVELDRLVRGVAAELAPEALRQGQVLELDAPMPCVVSGDPTLLAVLVRNLIDNALRYSPPEARIRVDVRIVAGATVLSVEDSGPGVTEADREHLGERFFRIPGSVAGGSGLGLSIVRRIAAVHGAVLELRRSESLGGLAARVVFGSG